MTSVFKNLHKSPVFLVSVMLILSFLFFVPTVYAQTESSLEKQLLAITLPTATPDPNSMTENNQVATPSPETDDYYSSLFAYSWKIPEEAAGGSTFWIEVNLRDQMLYAYRGDQIINAFLVSTGAGLTPTVTGTYKIYAKYNKYNMTGPDYEYPDVPYTLFFYKGYSIHGTYWHNYFGTPMSWGCVNMKTEEATWIYENAPVGTYVFIHN